MHAVRSTDFFSFIFSQNFSADRQIIRGGLRSENLLLKHQDSNMVNASEIERKQKKEKEKAKKITHKEGNNIEEEAADHQRNSYKLINGVEVKEFAEKMQKDGGMMNRQMCFMKGDKTPIPVNEWTFREEERERKGGCYENISNRGLF